VTSNTGPPPKRENNKKRAPSKLHSITGVNPVRSHGIGLWGNRRVVVGIRVDEGLYNAFKPVAKRVFGSVCNPLEAFMAAVLATAQSGVNFGNTVEVGTIVIERNLRERRRLVVEKAKPITASEVKCDLCGKVPAVGAFRHVSGIQKHACGYHAQMLKNHTKWETVNDSNPRPSKGIEETK